ncbi:MAG: dienelactone hydrolase family protein [Sphingobium sp.]
MADEPRGELLRYFDGDLELHGELYRPAGSSNGRAMLVVHEADGIGGNVHRHCAMLAELGYTVLAADMHGGGRVLEGAEMTAALEHFRADPDYLRARVRAGLDALLAMGVAGPEQTAAIGYCFGGFSVLELARSGAPVRAVGSFHGLLTTGRPAVAGQAMPAIAVYTGALDPLVPTEHVAGFQAEMMAADADWQMTVYGRALHSFTNRYVASLGDARMAYDAQAHAQSWTALLAFLDSAFSLG